MARLGRPRIFPLRFAVRKPDMVLSGLKDVAASTGSACHSGSVELSPVLKAMQVAPEIGMGAIRFSLGRTTTREEIEQVVSRLCDVPHDCHFLREIRRLFRPRLVELCLMG